MGYNHMWWDTSQKILYLRKVNDRLKSGMMYKTRLLVSVEAAESFYSLGWPLRLFCSLFLWGSVLLSVLEIMMTFIPTRQREVSQIVFLLAQLEPCMQLGHLKNRLTIYSSQIRLFCSLASIWREAVGSWRRQHRKQSFLICLIPQCIPLMADVCQQRICIRITWAMNEKYLEVKYCHESLRQFFQRIGKVYPKVSSFLSVNFASSLDIFQRA